MKHKVIRIPHNLHDDLVYLAGRKSLSQKDALEYAIRLAKSVEDSENQLKEEKSKASAEKATAKEAKQQQKEAKKAEQQQKSAESTSGTANSGTKE